jgi:hypothetical protein
MLEWVGANGQILALIGAVLAAIGIFVSDQYNDAQLRARDAEVKARDAQLLKLGSENAALQRELKVQAQETVRQVTGGNSFVVLYLAADPHEGEFNLIAGHRGETAIPAYDVNIFLEPTGKCDEMQSWTMRDVMATGVNNVRRHYLPAIGPAMALSLQVRIKPTCDDSYYLAVTYTRNRVTLQQILLRKTSSGWTQASRVIDPLSGEELWKHIELKDVKWPDLSGFISMLRRLPGAKTEPAP